MEHELILISDTLPIVHIPDDIRIIININSELYIPECEFVNELYIFENKFIYSSAARRALKIFLKNYL